MARRPRGAIRRAATGREDEPLIKVLQQRFLRGPNLHADRSAVLLTLSGENGLAVLARKLPDGPGGLADCELEPGGGEIAALVAAARRGLGKRADGWALALAIAEQAQLDHALVPARGRVIVRGDGRAEVLIPADSLEVGGAAFNLGATLVLAMHSPDGRANPARVVAQRRAFMDVLRPRSPDMSTLAIARKALANDIPVSFPAPTRNLIQMGQGHRARLAAETVLDPQSSQALLLARDKWNTLHRLRTFGLPVLPSGLAVNADQAVRIARLIQGPVVVKPHAGSKGTGISLNLTDEAAVRRAYALAARYGRQVLVEKYATGGDFRLTVVEGRLLAAAQRVPATVTGDGRSTVRELLDALNADPRRGPPFEKLMERVPIDERLDALLAQQGLSRDAVPRKGAVVKVALAANIAMGGTAVDVTERVHPDNRAAVEVAARACHALVAGVDFFTPDITRSWRSGVGWILEVNTSPGLRPHWIAKPEQDVVTPILRVAFPAGARSRIPMAGITGGAGKTAVCRMVAHIARGAGRHPALNTADGTWSGDVSLKRGDCAGGVFAEALLSDPAVDVAIVELAPKGLLDAGMVLDAVDVAAVLDLTEDAVGLAGVETREELAAVAAIPVRRAREWVFLHADEPLLPVMREAMAPAARLGLVSADPASTALAEHRAAGGCTVTLEGKGRSAKIVIRQGEAIELEFKLAGLPAAENAMFAAAIALRLGIGAEDIGQGLRSFPSDDGPGA